MENWHGYRSMRMRMRMMMMMVQQKCGLCERTKGTSWKRKTILANQVTPGHEQSTEWERARAIEKGEGEEGSCDSSQRKWKTCDLVDRLIRGICEIVWTPIEAWLCIANKHDRSLVLVLIVVCCCCRSPGDTRMPKRCVLVGDYPTGTVRLWCHCQCRR